MDKIAFLKKEEDIKLKKARIKVQREITREEHDKMLDMLQKSESLLKSKMEKELETARRLQHDQQEKERRIILRRKNHNTVERS
ncbi:MAG: hypothetical protein IID16_02010 [Candidatus Marinimicrobia bacterium]|nr:hypothetical protein [Candidatus Neomarinimicrobiota bacterium]